MRNWKLRNKKKQRRRKPYKKNLISSDSFEYERFRIPICMYEPMEYIELDDGKRYPLLIEHVHFLKCSNS